jgi:hypothetical protein
MAVIAGQRNTLNIDQNQRRIDIGNRIALLEPESTPLTALLNRIGSEVAISPKFQALEDELAARFDTVNGAIASGVTTLVVTNGGYFNVEDLILITRTSEMLRVTAVAGNSLTVTRGVGSTAAAINNLDEIYILSSAAMEGDVSKQARSETPSIVTNYTQIFRDPFDESATLRSSDTVHTPHDWPYVQNKKGIEHATRIERAFLFGKPSESGSPAVRTTGGCFYFIGTTNQTDAGGTFTETELWSAARPAFRYGRQRKLMLAGGLPIQVMNQFAQSKVQVRTGEDTYGLKITTYVTPFGELGVVWHPMLEGAVYGGVALILDTDAIDKKYLNGGVGGSRDTHLRENIQENDRDGRKDEYMSEVGLKFGQAKRHGSVTNITG